MSATDDSPGPGPDEFARYVRRVTRWSLAIAVVLVLSSLLWLEGRTEVPVGIALGSAFSVLKFNRRVGHLLKFAHSADGREQALLVRGRFESYLLAAVALALAFAWDGADTLAAVLSLFLTNVVVVVTAWMPSA